MDVLVRGMEMPKRCAECRLSTVYNFNDRPLCDVLVEYMSYGEWEAKRLDNCPLVPVPPHGRLGDLDALKALFKRYEAEKDYTACSMEQIYETLDETPAIIPAEEEEHDLLLQGM